jgi:nicotinate dehydrogenase subunit B
MTGFMHEKEFSRKSFLRGGGALIVGFSVAGGGLAGRASATAFDPYASNGPYDLGAVDSWITIHADNTAAAKFGVVEMGQGTLTALLMIVADELDLSMSQVRYVAHDTDVTPSQGATTGSSGIATGGQQVRAAAVAAKQALLGLAAGQLGVAKASLTVNGGVVSGGGKSVTYGALLGDKLFDVKIPGGSATTPARLAAGGTGAKPMADYRIVGTSPPRVDIPAKVMGTFTYVHNIRVPGMLHGRVVRPQGQGAYGDGTAPKILSVDEGSIKHIAGARVVRYGEFLGVVAPTEYGAIQAAAQLKVKWADNPLLSGTGNLFKQMRDHDSAGLVAARLGPATGNFDSAFASAATKLVESYKAHYRGHLPIGPSCCVADVTASGARIFSNTQDAYGLRPLVQSVLNQVMGSKAPPLNRIRVTYYEGSSVFGMAPYDDAAQSAAIMSALVGRPVRMQFMRWDEHGWDNYGSAHLTDVRAGLDASGKITALEYTSFGVPYFSVQPARQQVSGTAAPVGEASKLRITSAPYNIPNTRSIGKSLPLINNYLKVNYLRAPSGPQSWFPGEQMIDELAFAAKMDPIAFRLANIATTATDPALRWKNVLERVAELSKWKPKVAASNLSGANVVTGRGVAFGRAEAGAAGTVVAEVIDVEVNKKTGKIAVKHVYVVEDPGFIVYPEGLRNNEEGAIMHGVSVALHEQVNFDKSTVTSLDWVTYPILRFKDSPKITMETISRADLPDSTGSGAVTSGSGEPAIIPPSPAIANAFFDATGVRIREVPMTPARVRAALKAAGVA